MHTTLLTHQITTSLLSPNEPSALISAEEKRPWSRTWIPALRRLFPDSVLDQLWDHSLMRSYDAFSGSQPCPETSRMLARGARMRLDSEEIRTKTLETHIDHKKWEKTPYISFTNCPQDLEKLADFRRTRTARNHQYIVVIDPRIRIELGLPILHCGAEITHYQVKVPYGEDYWRNHYLCLWEVTPAEVAGIWDWDDLRKIPHWYENVIMPAVTRQRQHMESALSAQRNVHQKDQKPSADVGNFDEDIHWSGSDHSFNSEGEDEVGCGYESDDSYEKVCKENLSGQLMNMWEDLRLE